MLAEILDLAKCWSSYSASSTLDSRNFYLTEALLNLNSKNQEGFYEMIVNKQFIDQDKNQMFNLSMMKALLKD